MSDANEYARLMQEQRRGTSAQFPMLPPELQPSGEPLTDEEDSETEYKGIKKPKGLRKEDEGAWKDAIDARESGADARQEARDDADTEALKEGIIDRTKDVGKFIAGLPGAIVEPFEEGRQWINRAARDPDVALEAGEFARRVGSGDRESRKQLAEGASESMVEPMATMGDAMMAKYLAEEGKSGEAALYGASVFLPGIIGGFLTKGIKKAAKSGKGVSANELRARLSVIDEEATKHLTAIDERLATGTLSPDSADALRKKVADTVRERVGVAEEAYEAGKLGTVTRPFKSEAARRAEHEAAVAAGTATGPYKPLPAWGTGGMMEESISQPFMGGGIKPGGQPGKRIETVEDELRAARQVTDLTRTRRPTAFERKQLIEDGQITTRDPNARDVSIVSESGEVLLGKPVRKPAKDAPTPYPEETGEAIMGMPLTKEYTKGLGEGTEGMSKSLLHDLSMVAVDEIPLKAPGRRTVSGDLSRYFDTLTLDQQKRVLEIAKTKPGLGRDIARHEVAVAEAQARAAKPVEKSTPESRRKMAKSVAERRTAGLTRPEAQAELKGARKATGTTPMLKKRVAREAAQSDVVQRDFIRDVKGMTSRFSNDEIKFIEQEVKRGTMPADAASLEQFAKMKDGLNIVYDSGAKMYVPKGRLAPITPTKRAGTSASEGLRKGLPRAEAAPSGGTKAKPAVRPEIKRTDVGKRTVRLSADDTAKLKLELDQMGKKIDQARADIRAARKKSPREVTYMSGSPDVRDPDPVHPIAKEDLRVLEEDHRSLWEAIQAGEAESSFLDLYLKKKKAPVKRTDVGISPAERSSIMAERSALFHKENKTPADRARMKELTKSLATGKIE